MYQFRIERRELVWGRSAETDVERAVNDSG